MTMHEGPYGDRICKLLGRAELSEVDLCETELLTSVHGKDPAVALLQIQRVPKNWGMTRKTPLMLF